jgi:hypothetical protein
MQNSSNVLHGDEDLVEGPDYQGMDDGEAGEIQF